MWEKKKKGFHLSTGNWKRRRPTGNGIERPTKGRLDGSTSRRRGGFEEKEEEKGRRAADRGSRKRKRNFCVACCRFLVPGQEKKKKADNWLLSRKGTSAFGRGGPRLRGPEIFEFE